jgi:hypothetical protein
MERAAMCSLRPVTVLAAVPFARGIRTAGASCGTPAGPGAGGLRRGVRGGGTRGTGGGGAADTRGSPRTVSGLDSTGTSSGLSLMKRWINSNRSGLNSVRCDLRLDPVRFPMLDPQTAE